MLLCFFSMTAWPQETQPEPNTTEPEAIVEESPLPAVPAPQTPAPQTPVPQAPPPSSPYTHAYEVRQDIHKYASYVTLPLFAAEFALGQSLPSEPGKSGSAKGLHVAVGTGIVGLFFVETVTGGWNLWQSRHEKEHRTPRMIHSFLMIAANAGFVATASSTPSQHRPDTFNHDRNVHRNFFIASVGIGTAGYLLSVFGRL